MAWNTAGARKANLRASGIQIAEGDMFDLAQYLNADGEPYSFLVSGQGGKDDAYRILSGFISCIIGRWPLIVLHNEDPMVEAVVETCWKSLGGQSKQGGICNISRRSREFEPLFGLDELEIVRALRVLAEKLGYTVTPRFETVVRAHLAILSDIGTPASLSGLNYLCSYVDIGEFHDNVLALPSGPDYGQRIWAALDAGGNDSNNQFELLRTVVSSFALEASRCGWNPDERIATNNVRMAIEKGATYIQAIDNTYCRLVLPYIVEELRSARLPYVIVFWNVKADESLCEFLAARSDKFRFGFFDQNIVDALGGEEAFELIAEQTRVSILLKHRTGSTATTLSEMLGKFDAVRVDETAGSSRRFFRLLPLSRDKSVSVTTENRYRVMPEEIMSLGAGQAIVFDSGSDAIIFYN